MHKITIIGCGNMGLIYANSFLKYRIVNSDNLLLVEKNAERQVKLQAMNIGRVVTTTDQSIAGSDILILSVKPQDFIELAPGIKPHLKPSTIVLSIMAGIEISAIAKLLGHENIVRAMPNSPVEIGMGMTVFTASPSLTREDLLKVDNMLATTGRTLYVEKEQLLNAVTALSGSGPAYFFYFMQHLVKAGMEMGLDEHISSTLAKQTMLGAFHLINNASKPLDELIKAVASKGGTTEAALHTFQEQHMGETIVQALLNAEKRAGELSLKL
ncbi:MAG: pyrroline-5-carboxylate reductase [Bacteroidetes bacterium]|nr:pyrroline-5-carboxylate reductase [Bacteroidota bacterium]